MDIRESKLDIHTPTQIIFDQYSRYLACSKLLQNASLKKGASMLDVGSGPECLFGSFLPDIQITYLDPLISVMDTQHIKGNVFSDCLKDLSFSAVVAVDVLEHVPPSSRNAFLNRISELSSDVIILGFPNSDTLDASQTDLALERQYRNVYESDYHWLKEHHEYGLPSLTETQTQLENHGWYCQSVGHGYTPWLRELLGFVICGWDNPIYKDLILSISEQFNKQLAEYDFAEPSYRQFIVATRERPGAPIQMFETPQKFEEANRLFNELMSHARAEFYKLALNPPEEKSPQFTKLLKERDRARDERDRALTEQAYLEAQIQQTLTSASWRLTQPLRFGAGLVRHGLTKQDRQKLIQALRNQYHRLPIPVTIKKLVNKVYHHRLFRKFLVGVQRSVRLKKPFQLPVFEPKSQQYGKPDYIIWSVIDWHFRHQRPQQIALALAATGRRVFYISPLLVDDQRAGFEVEALDTSHQLFQIKLFANNAPSIYMDEPDLETTAQLKQSLGKVLNWTESKQINSLVDHPFWLDVANVVPNSRLIYDCMDHHAGFGNISDPLLQLEKRLLAEAELAICTSSWLKESVSPHVKQTILIRNAADYLHFSQAHPYRDPKGRRIIGYYGAIAEWFDVDLIEAVAKQHPDCCVLLIGADTVDASSRLSRFENITFVGEVPYEKLPHYLHGFDVCLLPFKVTPLTLATNPVKIYEYMCAGKPVVTVDLPEIAQFEGLVYAGTDKDAFLDSLRNVLNQAESEDLVHKRRAFAQTQTWRERTEILIKHAETSCRDPKVSIIVVT
ncbi:glycosyltransferase, partial [Pseudomonadota bacterium]|nr:glycosyltransferase [Pseudomonadota bacterium]